MAELSSIHRDRRRAESFGTAAHDYDRYRPRYPQELISRLVPRHGLLMLDVGAGTGIASMQFVEAGADVLAVEPDARMAEVCAAKGITVERNTFEEWDPKARRFDLVVFGQSFHWVEPESALTKVASSLRPAGRLVLMWNRIIAVDPSARHLGHIEAAHGVAAPSAPVAAEAKAAVIELLDRHRFSVDTVVVSEELSYSTDDWLNLQFTYSNHLILEQSAKTELRERLCQSIGPQGVRARNEALALVCTRTAD